VAFGEGVNRLFDCGEHTLDSCGRQGGGELAGGGQVPADEGTQSQARFRCLLSLSAQGLQFVPGQPAAGGADVGQDPGVPRQELVGFRWPCQASSSILMLAGVLPARG
jgi:hypothetical protein